MCAAQRHQADDEPAQLAEWARLAKMRPCGWHELPEVYRLHRACFPHPYGLARLGGYVFGSRSSVIVAAPPNKYPLVGYVIASLTPTFRPPGTIGEIISLGVLSEYRRLGLGRRLIQAAFDDLERHGIADVYLQVAVSNEPAQALYRELGFATTERLHRYYSDGEDAYLMRRRPDEGDSPPDV